MLRVSAPSFVPDPLLNPPPVLLLTCDENLWQRDIHPRTLFPIFAQNLFPFLAMKIMFVLMNRSPLLLFAFTFPFLLVILPLFPPKELGLSKALSNISPALFLPLMEFNVLEVPLSMLHSVVFICGLSFNSMWPLPQFLMPVVVFSRSLLVPKVII